MVHWVFFLSVRPLRRYRGNTASLSTCTLALAIRSSFVSTSPVSVRLSVCVQVCLPEWLSGLSIIPGHTPFCVSEEDDWMIFCFCFQSVAIHLRLAFWIVVLSDVASKFFSCCKTSLNLLNLNVFFILFPCFLWQILESYNTTYNATLQKLRGHKKRKGLLMTYVEFLEKQAVKVHNYCNFEYWRNRIITLRYIWHFSFLFPFSIKNISHIVTITEPESHIQVLCNRLVKLHSLVLT